MKRITYLGHNYYGIVIKFVVGFISAMLGYMEVIIFENIDMFRAISFVVFIDFVFGVIKAIKFGRFRVNMAMKVVYYLVSYWMILFVVLSIEKKPLIRFLAIRSGVSTYNHFSVNQCA